MREIKFRGMDVQGRWFFGNLTVLTRDVAQGHKQGHYISNSVGMPFAYRVRPETVGQYTGTRDKNGKEIYENDIIKNHTPAGDNHSAYDEIGIVIWDKNRIVAEQKKYGKYFPIIEGHSEVIGSIFETTESA